MLPAQHVNTHGDLPVSEGRDDEPWCVAQVLVAVLELSVADVDSAVLRHLVPPVPQLGLPGEVVAAHHLLGDHLADDVPGVDVHRADGHHLLPLPLREPFKVRIIRKVLIF